MKVRALFQFAEKPTPSIESKVFSAREEIMKLRNELEQERNEQERKKLQRKIARIERFSDIQEGKKSLEKKDEVQKILEGKNTENYLGSDLHMLRKRGVDIASLTLVSESNPAETAESAKMKTGDVFIVNFGGNESLARKIGAGDILPPEVTKVRINGVECERRNVPRPGYYNDSEKPSYQKIYDGYKIEVIERKDSISPEETKLAEDAAERRWKKIRISDMINNKGVPLTKLHEDTQFEKAAKEELTFRKKYKSIDFDISSLNEQDRGLLDFIGTAEGTGDNYNAIFGNGKQLEIKFTEMTLNEILEYQSNYKKGHGSAAIGRYQFMDYTLKSMMEKHNINGNSIFSPEMQDKLAFLKLNERGLNDFKNGYITKEGFQMNLAQEWAAIAKDSSGLSYYDGDKMNNHASTSGKEVLAVLDKLYPTA